MTIVILMLILGGLLLLGNAIQQPNMGIVQYFNTTVIQGKWK